MADFDAVLWDFGGVILASPFEAFSRYEAEHGLPSGFIRSVNATNADDNAWARLERGEVDLAGFARLFEEETARAGHRVDGMDVLGLLSGDVRPAMVDALRRLRDHGFRLAMLTNNFVGGPGEGMAASRPELAEVLDLFDVMVESSQIGVRKPEPRFYELALERVGTTAERAVFLDDLGVNLKPARAMGMATIKVVDPEEALTELEHLLGIDLRSGPADAGTGRSDGSRS